MRKTILLLFMVLSLVVPQAYCADFEIEVSSTYTEVEEGFNILLYANCTDELGDCHEDNVTFTISGVAFTYNDWNGLYQAVVSKSTPQTIEYGTLDDFDDSENVTSSAEIISNATITWTQSRLDFIIPYARTGDLFGLLFNIASFMITPTFLYTFIVCAVSLACYNYSGWEATLLCWILMWGGWSAVVHGTAQGVGLAMLSLGGGLLIAKIYMDRRAT